jgi:hypothetical protein
MVERVYGHLKDQNLVSAVDLLPVLPVTSSAEQLPAATATAPLMLPPAAGDRDTCVSENSAVEKENETAEKGDEEETRED